MVNFFFRRVSWQFSTEIFYHSICNYWILIDFDGCSLLLRSNVWNFYGFFSMLPAVVWYACKHTVLMSCSTCNSDNEITSTCTVACLCVCVCAYQMEDNVSSVMRDYEQDIIQSLCYINRFERDRTMKILCERRSVQHWVCVCVFLFLFSLSPVCVWVSFCVVIVVNDGNRFFFWFCFVLFHGRAIATLIFNSSRWFLIG